MSMLAKVSRTGLSLASRQFAGHALRRTTSTAVPGRLHQPLGTVPSGVDLESVRQKWGSDAMEKIHETDVIEVDGPVAICDGGGGPLGHPIEYIKLLVTDDNVPQVCKYCGTKYRRKRH